MAMKIKNPRLKRKIRIRKKISGTASKPRLAVFKSNKNIYVQAIDDLGQKTIATASTLSSELKNEKLTVETSKKVGEKLGEALSKIGIKEAVFDRGGYIYHGRVEAVAEGIREKGIKF
jgi:large subunit ribosomal protein L18|tara:strand:- start:794 stop:1147 length:354 start_codon:yes stop_codon:yes gene_type:complete